MKLHPCLLVQTEIICRFDEFSMKYLHIVNNTVQSPEAISAMCSCLTSTTPIIPIYTYDVMGTLTKAKALFDAGVYVNPVLPPATPDGACLLRTSYMASHTEELLDEAMDCIASVMHKEQS